jgi:hypothetical protein
MLQDEEGVLHYSAHRHDFKIIGNDMIDGGRAYTRTSVGANVQPYKVKDGEFVNA